VLCVPKSACAERVIGTPFFCVFPSFILILFHSQVHDIHPSHPFILVPDKPKRSTSEPDFMASQQFDSGDEQCRGSPHKDTFRPVTLFSFSYEASRSTVLPVCPHLLCSLFFPNFVSAAACVTFLARVFTAQSAQMLTYVPTVNRLAFREICIHQKGDMICRIY